MFYTEIKLNQTHNIQMYSLIAKLCVIYLFILLYFQTTNCKFDIYCGLRKVFPAYLAPAPNSSSIRRIWLYFANRSERHGAPVLI